MPTIYGTNGDDAGKYKLVQDNLVAVKIYGYDGDDDIYLNRTDSRGGNNYVDAGRDDDMVVNYFEGGNDVFLGSGNDLYIADIRARDSKDYDVVHGGSGNDRFEVSSVASDYYGDDGNDIFLSVGDNNAFYGGSGTDTISYVLQDKVSSQVGRGVTIDLGKGSATTGSGRTEILSSIENAYGTENGNDIITGSSVRNVLKGLGDNDVLKGLGGNDALEGGNGNDDLYGGSGNDFLTGGRGIDYLNGGKGADVFEFANADSGLGSRRDIIADFYTSEGDTVDLSAMDANTTRSGNQSFSFIGTSGFSDRAGELRFKGGMIYGDTDGDGVADFQIEVTGVNKMYSGDFYL